MNLILFSTCTIAIIFVEVETVDNNVKKKECDICDNTEIVPTRPGGSKIQEILNSLDIDTLSFESSDIYRIDYTLRSRWTVDQSFCKFYLGFLKHHGYFSERDENSNHEDVRLVITEDVYKKFVWTPDTSCLSAREEDEPSSTDSKLAVVTIEADDDDKRWPNQTICNMELQRKLYIVSACSMDLKTYPVDIQSCPVKFGSFILDEGDVIYKWIESSGSTVTLHNESKLNEYEISKIETSSDVRLMFGEKFTTISFTFTLDRHFLSTFIGMYVPSGLIVALSWLSLWISPLTPPARANLLVTALLALLTQFTASRAGLPSTSDVTSLDIWFLVCFAFLSAALIQFTIVKTITTRTDDQGKLSEEDEEFQEKHRTKEKVEGIARKWKSQINPGQFAQNLDENSNGSKVAARPRKQSIPFASVPAASRFGQNVQKFTRNVSIFATPVSHNGSDIRTYQEYRQINAISPHYERLKAGNLLKDGSLSLKPSGSDFSDGETFYSPGLESISLQDSVFNSPPSSHFYYSPDIVTQKPITRNASSTHPLQLRSEFVGEPIYQSSAQPTVYGTSLAYLSPIAPDYIKRNLSTFSRSLTPSITYSSNYSEGPSSFHTSKWYYETCKQNNGLKYRRNTIQSDTYSNRKFVNQASNNDNYDEGDRVLNWKPVVADLSHKGVSRLKKMGSFDDLQNTYQDKNDNSIKHHRSKSKLRSDPTTKLRNRNRINSSDIILNPSKKAMKKVEDRIYRKELVKKIEKYSQILFPLSFILFNIFYWPYIYNR